jgi:hypothetical protein
MLTLKQVIKRLEVLATAHKQINHFLFGDPIEYLTNGEVKYPACFVTLNNGSIDREEMLTGWSFDILFCDLANTATKSQESELDVLNDLSLIAEDFKALLGWHEYRDWYIASASPIEYLKEEFEDVVLAVKMQVKIERVFDSDRCQVPVGDVEFPAEETGYFPQPTGFNKTNIFTAAGAPSVSIGNEGDLYIDSEAPNKYYKKESGAWVEKGILQGLRGEQGEAGATGAQGPQGIQGETGPQGPEGPQGATGDTGAQGATGVDGNDGWTPVFAVVSDDTRRVLQVSDWTGGEGTKPATGQYVGATGLVSNIASAVDIRGAQGETGATGATGPAGPTAVSADANNMATLGTDSKIYVGEVSSVGADLYLFNNY